MAKKLTEVDKNDLKLFVLLIAMLCITVAICMGAIIYRGYDYSVVGLLLAFVVSVYLADFSSGIFHFLVDYTPLKRGVGLDLMYYYEGSKSTPDYMALRKRVLKKAGIWQRASFFFKMHHFDTPRQIAIRPAFTTFLPTLPVAILLFLLSLFATAADLNAYASLIMCLSGMIVFWAQYIHSLTHGRKSLRIVSWLQKHHMLLNRTHHGLHHKHPDQYFCFINGWADPLVNKISDMLLASRFFHRASLSMPERVPADQ